MPAITAADLRRFAPHADPRIVAAFVDHSDATFARWGLTTAKRQRMFMAQVQVESAGLRVLAENMDYTAARIHAVWPSRFRSVTSAARFAHAPKALAIQVYGGRMGNRPGTDDGWICRGQGLLDNTGRAGLERLAAYLGLSLDETRDRLTSDEGMIDCAAATFVMLGCLPFADRDDLVGCTKRINGGLTGLSDRRAALRLATRIWPTARPLRAVAPIPAARTAPPPSIAAHSDKPSLRPPPAAPTSWLNQLLTALEGS